MTRPMGQYRKPSQDAFGLVVFGLQQIGLALIEIVILLLAIIANAILFWRIDRLAGALRAVRALGHLRDLAQHFAMAAQSNLAVKTRLRRPRHRKKNFTQMCPLVRLARRSTLNVR